MFPFLFSAVETFVLNKQTQKVMKKNMGATDRLLRVIVALIIAALYTKGTIAGTTGIVLMVLAIVFVLTSLVSFCPLYLPFGINTCKSSNAADKGL